MSWNGPDVGRRDHELAAEGAKKLVLACLREDPSTLAAIYRMLHATTLVRSYLQGKYPEILSRVLDALDRDQDEMAGLAYSWMLSERDGMRWDHESGRYVADSLEKLTAAGWEVQGWEVQADGGPTVTVRRTVEGVSERRAVDLPKGGRS